MKRSVLLDLFRVLAVSAVILGHVLQELDNPWGNKIGIPGFYHVTMGGIGVTILLIISGIVLRLRYLPGNYNYLKFYQKRLLRIYPIYYLILAGGILAYLIRRSYGLGPLGELSYLDIPLALTATYAMVGRWGGPFIGTSWFIGMIMSLYLVYPLLARWVDEKPRMVLLFMFIISAGSRFLLGQVDLLPLRPLDWFVLCRVFEFSLGIFLAKLLPVDFWQILNSGSFPDGLISYLGELSFPLFLAHWPILHTVKHLRQYSVSNPLWLFIFLILLLGASAALLEIDRRVLTPRLKG